MQLGSPRINIFLKYHITCLSQFFRDADNLREASKSHGKSNNL